MPFDFPKISPSDCDPVLLIFPELLPAGKVSYEAASPGNLIAVVPVKLAYNVLLLPP